MKFLAIITARSGSKRIKNKNLSLINGKPLIFWSIKHIQKIKEIKKITISTDSIKILNKAKKFGIKTNWIRPKKISKDSSSSEDVVKHAYMREKKNGFDAQAIILFQPTTPFRTKNDIYKCINLYKSDPNRPVISVTRIKHPTKLLYPYKSKLKILKMNKPLFLFNGSILIIGSKQIKSNNYLKLKPNFVEFKGIKNNIDIDNHEELKLARILFDKNI